MPLSREHKAKIAEYMHLKMLADGLDITGPLTAAAWVVDNMEDLRIETTVDLLLPPLQIARNAEKRAKLQSQIDEIDAL